MFQDPSQRKSVKQDYMFYSGPPSSHTAVLSMTTLYVFYVGEGISPLLLVTICFSILWIYEIVMQRIRFNQLITVLGTTKDPNSIKLIQEYNGHSFSDIIIGMITGIAVFYFLGLILGLSVY